MRVAIITNGGIGGGYNNQGLPFLSNLVNSLADECEIDVYSFAPNGGLQPKNFNVHSISGTIKQPFLFKFIKMWFLLSRANRKHQYDVFHAIWPFPSGFITVLLGKLFGVKTIVSMQGGGLANIPEIKYGGNQIWIKRQINAWTLKHATHLTTLTAFLQALIPTEKLKGKNTIIYYGVDLNKFKYQEKTIASTIQFVHIANISAVKDQTTLLKCFQLISQQIDCKLTIAGPDYYNEGLIQQLVKDLNLADKVKFLDFVPHEDIPDLLSNAHMMLHTSMHEGMGTVIAEALASGVLVCGTKVGLLADLPEDCCITVSLKSHDMLATKVLDLLKDEQKMMSMRSNGYEWVKKYNHERCVHQYLEIYNELIN